MVDVISPAVRSALMSRIKGKNTKPEMIVRKGLWARGFRFGLHGKRLPGRPDLVLPKWNAVVFVHGCFWHRHEDCPNFRLPKTRSEFWDHKLGRNQLRDRASIHSLRSAGWRVALVWECSLRLNPSEAIDHLGHWLVAGPEGAEIRARQGFVSTEQLSHFKV